MTRSCSVHRRRGGDTASRYHRPHRPIGGIAATTAAASAADASAPAAPLVDAAEKTPLPVTVVATGAAADSTAPPLLRPRSLAPLLRKAHGGSPR